MQPATPDRPQLPLPVVVVGVAVAALVALALLQWVIGVVFGVLRLALVVVVVAAVVVTFIRLLAGRR